MTHSLIGYNVHSTLTYGRAYSADEQARMWGHFERLQPASLLILDNFDWAKEAKRRLPNTIVEFRQYQSNDGRYFMNMTAQQFYDSHARIGDAGLVVSVMNEPTGYGEQNKPEDLENVARFMAQVMDLHGRAGHSICGPEFGVGHPDLNRLAELDEMWAAFARWPQHYYGCHEYGTYRGMQHTDETHTRDVYPHRVGRYKSILAYVGAKFAYTLPVIVNEWGIDSSFYSGDDTNKRGWRDAGNLSDLEYAKQLIKCAKEVYTEPNVKGLNIFAHGNTGKQFTAEDWRTHDVSFLPAFMVALEDYAKETTMPSLPLPTDARWRESTNVSGANYRVRLTPQVNDSNELGWINKDERFHYIPVPNDTDWIYAKNAGGRIGYAHKDVLTVAPAPTPPPPPDEPPINLTIILKQHREQWQAMLDTAKRNLEALEVTEHRIKNDIQKARMEIAQLETNVKDIDLIQEVVESAAKAA